MLTTKFQSQSLEPRIRKKVKPKKKLIEAKHYCFLEDLKRTKRKKNKKTKEKKKKTKSGLYTRALENTKQGQNIKWKEMNEQRKNGRSANKI